MTGVSKTNLAQLNNIKLLNVTIKGRSGVGSLLGKIDDNQYVVIDRCSVVGGTGDYVQGYRACGGLVGANNGYPSGNPSKARSKMYECFANVPVSFIYDSDAFTALGGGIKFGGLVGCNQRGETYDSYALGSVTGLDGGNNAQRVGGLAGCVEQGLIVNCFSAGLVLPASGGTNVGGLVGKITGGGTGGVTYSYWDTTTSGQSSSASGTGLDTAGMQTDTPFTNWNNGFWTFSSTSNAYPSLNWNDTTTLANQQTNTTTLIYQGSRSYLNSDIGSNGNYIAFQSEGSETTEFYLIYTVYSTDNTLSEVSSFAHPENLGAYCQIWFEYITVIDNIVDVPLSSLPTDSYLDLQLENVPNDLWYRFYGGDWQLVPDYTDVTDAGGDEPTYTYQILLTDLDISTRLGTNGIEFAGDNGDNPLPVTLNSFSAVFDGEIPILQWTTVSEINNAGWNVFAGRIY